LLHYIGLAGMGISTLLYNSSHIALAVYVDTIVIKLLI